MELIILTPSQTENEFIVHRGGQWTFSAGLPEGRSATFSTVTLQERWYYTDTDRTEWADSAELTEPGATILVLDALREYRAVTASAGAVASCTFIFS